MEKVHIFVRFLLIIFFGTFLKNFFNGFEISVRFCVFDTSFDFLQRKIFLGHISTYKGKQFFLEYSIWVWNTQNITLISNPLKKLHKFYTKSYKQNKLTQNSSLRETHRSQLATLKKIKAHHFYPRKEFKTPLP